MKKILRKIDWNKFRIRNRKDWTIFWVFAVLICYAAGLQYNYLPDRWLFQFANPYMMDLNQPYTWGQLIIFFSLIAVVVEAVLFLCNKPVKAKVLVLVGALLMPMVILAGYRIHTNLIVSSLWKEEPARVTVWWRDEDSGIQENQVVPVGEEKQRMLELCRNLVPVSDEESLEILKQWYQDNNTGWHMQEDSIQLSFAKKYGHNYNLWLRVYDGRVFLWRGYSNSQKAEITFFEDNGIVEWMEGMKKSAESLAAQGTH